MKISRRGLVTAATMTAAGTQLGRASVITPATGKPAPNVPMPPPAVPTAQPVSAVVAPPPTVFASVDPRPRWVRYAVTPPRPDGRPVIAVVIDDMGVMHANTNRAVALPAGNAAPGAGPLTFAWFPFAPRLDEQVEGASAAGHETILHMPMQAFGNSSYQVGPDPLRIDLLPAENLARLQAAIETMPGAVGLNNHMGSVATRDPALMELVARETKARDMLFLDSLTVAHSVALSSARAEQVPSSARDVFIDNSPSPTLIRGQLDLIEREARNNGRVIAIGHPRPNTLEALEAWLPTLAGKGFVLWPLAATIAYQNSLPIPGGITV